jgi:hypothetical protein
LRKVPSVEPEKAATLRKSQDKVLRQTGLDYLRQASPSVAAYLTAARSTDTVKLSEGY